MTDLDFIVGLGNTERDALGFIPKPAIQRRMTAPGHYAMIRDHTGRRRGFLLHGPPSRGLPLHIYQVCVEYDFRLRGHAAEAVRTIYRRGLAAGATDLVLRCALDLQANLFWQALGFTLIQHHVGGTSKNRIIAEYSLPIRLSEPKTLIIPTA